MRVRHRRYGGTPRTRLAEYVAAHAREWVEGWLEEVRSDPGTTHYHGYADTDELVRDTEALYRYLAIWLRTEKWDPRIDPHYERIGRDRFREGFPLSEIIAAILLAKRHLWAGVVADRQLSVSLELQVTTAIAQFYDRAIHHTALGYERAAAAAAGG